MRQEFRTINSRRGRKPNNLNAISYTSVVRNERIRMRRAEQKETKGVEIPKSNVRNTTRAETRVKRCSRNVGKRCERVEEGWKGPQRYLERFNSRFQTKSEIYQLLGKITEESYAHFARAARSHRQFRIGTRDRIVTAAVLLLLVLSYTLRALKCSVSWYSHGTKSSESVTQRSVFRGSIPLHLACSLQIPYLRNLYRLVQSLAPILQTFHCI